MTGTMQQPSWQLADLCRSQVSLPLPLLQPKCGAKTMLSNAWCAGLVYTRSKLGAAPAESLVQK